MSQFDDRYRKSRETLKRASDVIPLGSQTFSKSYQQLPHEAAPLFLERGRGSRVWDIDGNEYVDLINGLLPVLLGYCDPDVDDAIRAQLDKGICFSLATELESELAERLVSLIPCAEMVRFAKNGSDATTGCVRVARAATGRDHIITCGYHGWHDWYVAATVRNKGIPDAYGELTHRVAYNDLKALEACFDKHPHAIAAVVLEPTSVVAPKPGYLQGLVDLAHARGALVVFDEVITGFRFSLGGAQEYFGVTPDLAAFGKALGNGMPISAVVGPRSLMREMEEVFFSGTFGGECLSLAASIAVIDKCLREPVIDTLWRTGGRLVERVAERIESAGLSDYITILGLSPWTVLDFKDHPNARHQAIKTLLFREMLLRGVLMTGSHNISYAHTEEDLNRIDQAYVESLAVVATQLRGNGLEQNLGGPVIEPVFKVR